MTTIDDIKDRDMWQRTAVPYTHVGNASDHPSLTGLVFQAAARWAKQQNREYNLITSAGPNATQSVFHLHIHYVPRTQGDGLPLPWTGQRADAAVPPRGGNDDR